MLAALVVMGVTQVGSGQGAGPVEISAPDSTTTSEPGPDSTTSTVAPEPFTYRVGVLAGISTDNFWAFYGDEPSVWNSYILGPTKPALFTSTTGLGALEPELALDHTEPEAGDDGWTVSVELNPEMKWSDGTAITSADVVFTFETVRRLGLGGSWAESFPESVASIEAEGEHRIRIGFSDRPRLAVWPYGVGTAPVMATHVWADAVEGVTAEELYDLSGETDVSGGPLAISSIGDDLIVSMHNDGYASAGTPDVVEYHVYPDEQSAVTALREAEIDYLLSPKGLAGDHVEQLEGQRGIEVVTSPGNNIRYLGFNLTRAPMSDGAFRTALALLVDRGQLAGSIPHAGAPARAMIPEANTQWFDLESAEANAGPYRGELEKRLMRAVETLETAGYAWETAPAVDADGELVPGEGLTRDGVPTPTLTILTPGDAYDPARAEYARAISDSLAVLGFEARPVETDFDTVVDLAFTPDEDGELHYDMYLLGWTLGNPALPGYYGALFSEDGLMNNTGYASEEFEAALDTYEKASDIENARAALWTMEAILSSDLPYLALYSSEIVEAYRSDRVQFGEDAGLGGLQARLGGIEDMEPSD